MYKKGRVYGVGINDADYKVHRYELIDGELKQVWVCRYYRTWTGMLQRCYSEKYLKKKPSYDGSSVCEEWLLFSAFRKWMVEQDWEEIDADGKPTGVTKQLDKDVLSGSRRGKLYCPETCVFVSQAVNLFLTSSKASRGDLPIGVQASPYGDKFLAKVSNLRGKQEHLGTFLTVKAAHRAYIKRKTELAVRLASEQTDPRVAAALLNIDWSETDA